MARAGLELTGRLGGANATRRVFASYSDTDKEAPRREHVEHAVCGTFIVGAGRERREDDEDNGRQEERVGARPAVGEVAEEQLADDDAGKGDGGDILRGRGLGVYFVVLAAEDGVDGANDLPN